MPKKPDINEVIKSVWNGVIPEDFIYWDVEQNRFSIGGELRSNLDITVLKQEADAIRTTKLFPVLVNGLTRLALKQAATATDNTFSKALLYNIELLNQTVEQISNIKLPEEIHHS